MPNESRVNGNLRLIIYVLLGGLTIGSAFYAIGASSHDSIEADVDSLEECTGQLKQDSTEFRTQLKNIERQLEKQDVKLDRILEAL